MEDDNELGMGLFEGNQELNFNFAIPEDDNTEELFFLTEMGKKFLQEKGTFY